MSTDLDALEAFAGELLASLEPTARAELARRIARELRQSQQKRIAAQQNPDGSAFAPRKARLRAQRGKLRRQMFARIRLAKHLKTRATGNEAVVAFTARVSHIARAHQFGLRDHVDHRRGIKADYPARQLLGISVADEALIRDLAVAHLAGRP